MAQASEPRRKTDRDEVFVEFTKSVCPLCKTPVDAQVNIRDDKVYLRKRCREHGEFEALVYGDAEEYLSSARFNKPGTVPLVFQTEVKDGCPSDCGLCPEHKQHACLGIIEVNTGCNLDCPICFADSGHPSRESPGASGAESGPEGGGGYSLSREQCATMLDAFVESEGEAEVVMFSGGEPTIHKHILDFVDLAQTRPIRNVTLNTNGIRLATDRAFVAALGERNRVPGRSVNIYLQFDGFDERTHLRIRGRDLRSFKQRALDNCAEAGLTVALVAAVERGLNEHELGAVIEYGIDHPAVRSVVFQPVTHSGRHLQFDPLDRLTNPDVIRLIGEQRPDWFRKGDFFPVPCCFPTCRSLTYLLVDGEPGDRTVVPIPRLLNVEDHLDYVTNRVMPDPAIREALEKLWSASAFMGAATTGEKLRATAEALDCTGGGSAAVGGGGGCGIDLPEAVKDLDDKAFMIVVQDFQDPYTLNVKQDRPHRGRRRREAPVMSLPPGGEELKACCAAAYASDIVALLLGDSYHPGGSALTRRLADGLGLTPGARVLDVASGRGTTALLLADAYGAEVDGVDYAPANTALARGAARAAGLADRVRFTTGDAEQLPSPGGAFDAVVCECALCTFPDKARAAAEFARVLRPGGRLGLTDVTVDPARLPPELSGLGARIACIADARPLREYVGILAGAGLRTLRTERHDEAVLRMIDQIEARLDLLRITASARLDEAGADLAAAPAVLDAARAAVADGVLGYALLIAERTPQ
ncbi:methyltransferase domain-containing protein [Streptomyces sp. MS06]|uniref:methyltransferase domain-containing protein n=1 Tax=Streptomyces sp. MS06 TaxID=3385974 RepID=UPI0039A264CC